MNALVRSPIVLAILLAAGTLLLGWWAVPAIAAVWGIVYGRDGARGAGGRAALAGALAWLALLAFDAARGPLLGLATILGGVMGLPPVALVAVTLVFPALAAWSAATIAVALATPAPARSSGRVDRPVGAGSRLDAEAPAQG
jgi:hypothetical protein